MGSWALQLTSERSPLFALIGIALALGLSPGPASLYVTAHALRNGRRAGMTAAVGLCAGTVFTGLICSRADVSTLLTNPDLAIVFRKVAAAYLLFLAVMLARRRPRQDGHAPVATKRGRMIFVGGCLLNVLNPYQYSFYILVVPSVIGSVGGTLDRAAIIKGGLIYLSVVAVIYVSLALTIGGLRQFAALRPQTARHLIASPAVLLAAAAAYLGFGNALR